MGASPSDLCWRLLKRKDETVNEITLRGTQMALKRQGTPRRSRIEMSHHVVEGDSHQAESKGLAGESERLIGHGGEQFSPRSLCRPAETTKRRSSGRRGVSRSCCITGFRSNRINNLDGMCNTL